MCALLLINYKIIEKREPQVAILILVFLLKVVDVLEQEDVRKVKLCDLLSLWLMKGFLCGQGGVESELTVLEEDIV